MKRAAMAVVILLPLSFAFAENLPPPTDTSPIPEPTGRVSHIVEVPYPHHPVAPAPPNAMTPPYVNPKFIQNNDSVDPELTPQDMPSKIALPQMHAPLVLTLRDAVLLALRYNQNVESSQLTRVNDKYNLYLAQREFVPSYNLSSSALFTSANRPLYGATAGVNLRTPLGTQFGLNYATVFPAAANASNFGVVTFTAMQPLIQGFGFVNKVQLLNAYDTEENAKLNFKSSVISAVDGVITAYRTLVSDYNNLDVQKRNLDDTQITTNQYKLQLKSGKMAVSDVVQQEAQLAQAKLNYEQQRILVEQDYRAFLESLGLAVNANINIDRKINLGHYDIPPAKAAIVMALANNIPYQQALLNLRIAERLVIQAQDSRLPTLNVGVTETFQPSGLGLLNPNFVRPPNTVRNTTTSSAVAFNLTVPIDNVQGKANYIASRITVMQAKLALTQTKETLVSTILNDIAQLKSLREQVILSQQSVAFQKKTFENFELKLKYGKATVNDVTQNQTLYINQALQLIGLEISFLNQITQFQSDLGITLDVWNIKLRY